MGKSAGNPSEIDAALVTWEGLLAFANPGDLIFEWSENIFAHAIEAVTHGPSHVIQLAAFPEYDAQMYAFEAVFAFGVRLLPVSHYAHDRAWRVLCRRRGATVADVRRVTGRSLTMLGRHYEVTEELEMGGQVIDSRIKVGVTENRVFCSGLVQYNFFGSGVAFPVIPGNATPVFLYADEGTEVLCKCAPHS